MKQRLTYIRLLCAEISLRRQVKRFGSRMRDAQNSTRILLSDEKVLALERLEEMREEGAKLAARHYSIIDEIQFCKIEIIQQLGKLSHSRLIARLSLFESLKLRTSRNMEKLKGLRRELLDEFESHLPPHAATEQEISEGADRRPDGLNSQAGYSI